jgi:hypothetical protein
MEQKLKNCIKLLYTPAIYNLLRNYNRSAKKSDDTVVVIAGGDAINYYVDDTPLLTKDFDLKFCVKDLGDWKEYYDPNPNFNTISSKFEKLSRQVTTFCTSFLAYDAAKKLSNQAEDSIKKIFTQSGKTCNVKLTIEPGFETAAIFGLLKDNYTGQNQAAFKYLDNLKTTTFRSRTSIMYHLVVEEFIGGNRFKIVDFREGLVDGVCWSPISYGYLDCYKALRQKYIIDTVNPTASLAEIASNDLTSYKYGLLNRNFSFVMTSDSLCVVSIAFLLWDTVRLVNDSQHYLENTVQSQWSNPHNVAMVTASHYKYLAKYYYILEALFSKLRCVEPFRQAAQLCAANTSNNNETDLYRSLENQLKHILTSELKLPDNLISLSKF